MKQTKCKSRECAPSPKLHDHCEICETPIELGSEICGECAVEEDP